MGGGGGGGGGGGTENENYFAIVHIDKAWRMAVSAVWLVYKGHSPKVEGLYQTAYN